MARKKDIDARIKKLEEVEKEIEKTETVLSSLKEQKKAIEKEIKDAQVQELMDVIEKSGKSIDEVKELLNK